MPYSFPTSIPPASEQPERFQAEVRCERCGKTYWIDFRLRREGTREAKTANYTARCQDRTCPRDSDYTEWTGHVRPKPGMWKDADDTGSGVAPIPLDWI